MSKLIDLTGMTFDRLKVLRIAGRNKSGKVLWECKCNCKDNNIVVIIGDDLKNGKTRSCGCLHKEIISKNKSKQNIFIEQDDYYIGITNNTNAEFIIDKDDYEKIKSICWLENDQGYIIGRLKNGKNVRMHRYILGLSKGDEIVDHADTNKKNNRKDNLRMANKQLNNINRGCCSNNKLGFKGIVYMKNYKKYRARIEKLNDVFEDYFDTINEAIKWQKDKEIELYGDFSYKGVDKGELYGIT